MTLKLNLVIIYNITVEGVVNQVCCHSELVSESDLLQDPETSSG